MAEQSQLLLLKIELDKITRGRRNASILSWVIGVIVVIIVWGLQNWATSFVTDFWDLIIWAIIGVTGWLTASRYYNAKEAQVIWQIKQLTRESSPDNKF
jgi:hypothetical protein